MLPRHLAGDIHITAPSLHFLTGKSLSRLHDGAAVPFDFQLIISSGSKDNVVARSVERFTVSYDVWEEKFSVVRVRDFRRSGMRLSASSAESWCLDNIVIPAAGLPAGQQLWARLEIRSAESKEPLAETSGINLATLIEHLQPPVASRSRIVGRWNRRRSNWPTSSHYCNEPAAQPPDPGLRGCHAGAAVPDGMDLGSPAPLQPFAFLHP